jgi:hypothetical protein
MCVPVTLWVKHNRSTKVAVQGLVFVAHPLYIHSRFRLRRGLIRISAGTPATGHPDIRFLVVLFTPYYFIIIILFVRLIALRPLLAYCASLG